MICEVLDYPYNWMLSEQRSTSWADSRVSFAQTTSANLTGTRRARPGARPKYTHGRRQEQENILNLQASNWMNEL